ncbi:hypothetical protein [Demequina aestuarii]|uniref:hypothetical protein n=1 Tax=Demequina aestuarii TaxID=327095 RepID=UPI000785CA75|nr:hypothetical protein [Demequina aestuarii]
MGTWTGSLALLGGCVLALTACGVGLPQPPDPATSITSVAPEPAAPAGPPSASSAGSSPSRGPVNALPAPEPSVLDLLPRSCPTFDDGHDAEYVAIEPHRYAHVCLGMTFAEASAAMPGLDIAGDASCPWHADIVSATPLVISAVTSRDEPGQQILALRVAYLADLAGLDPWEIPRTAEAVGIGSTREAVRAAYPGAEERTVEDPERGPRDQMIAPQGAGLAYVFDVTDGLVSEMTWGIGLDHGVTGDLCTG